ncbi:disease resistance protein RUN1-like [Castanea sativa]|uniref:disease resistance protein RUN1-like n=1 Tax=Castanea sativa TaxID=21020 RepID=UPI003F64B44C
MVAIHGLTVIGKTTIAKAIYNKIADGFEGSSFLENVKERSRTNDGIIQLQEVLLSKLLGDGNLKVDNISRGITVIMEKLRHKRVLLVLDDVDEWKQIENLLGKCYWLAPGICMPSKMMNKEAYLQLSKQFINYTDGLPLALKIIGSDLRRKSLCEWESALEKYKNIPNKEVLKILKISYEGLDQSEKNIFLDIAFFFRVKKKDYVVNILEACHLFPNYGIPKLIDKCLITIDWWGYLSMHNLLQQMGEEIVQQESPQALAKHTRLQDYVDACTILSANMFILKLVEDKCCFLLQFLPFENLKEINLTDCESIQKLPELRAPNLEILDLSDCTNLVEIHEPVGFLDKLKYLNLSGCQKLKALPKRLKFKCLKYFNLRHYSRATKIEKLLNIELNDIRMVAIHSLAGIGKTTITKAIYNKIADGFEGSSFLENVKERSRTNDGIIQLQEVLLSKLLRDGNLKVGNISREITVIMENLRHKRVLLVLDDVDEWKQIENLLGKCDWLAPGSRILITTTDKHVLTTRKQLIEIIEVL